MDLIIITTSSTSLKKTSSLYQRTNSSLSEQVRSAMVSANYAYYQINLTMMALVITQAKTLVKD